MAAQHTPAPWEARASRLGNDVGIIVKDPTAEGGWAVIAECFSEIRKPGECALPEAAANAQRIVHCVNVHDELLAELTKAADQLQGWVNWKCPAKHVPEHEAYIAGIRALIAKATGGAQS